VRCRRLLCERVKTPLRHVHESQAADALGYERAYSSCANLGFTSAHQLRSSPRYSRPRPRL
jgi:hypothetical protein